jgi:hypothetical protein
MTSRRIRSSCFGGLGYGLGGHPFPLLGTLGRFVLLFLPQSILFRPFIVELVHRLFEILFDNEVSNDQANVRTDEACENSAQNGYRPMRGWGRSVRRKRSPTTVRKNRSTRFPMRHPAMACRKQRTAHISVAPEEGHGESMAPEEGHGESIAPEEGMPRSRVLVRRPRDHFRVDGRRRRFRNRDVSNDY